MAEIVQEITDEGLRLPRRLLEEWGYTTGRRMLITGGSTGVTIRPAEATGEEIVSLALRYLLAEVGDLAAVRELELHGDRWNVSVALRPQGHQLGVLRFSLDGTLLAAESTTPSELIKAADAA